MYFTIFSHRSLKLVVRISRLTDEFRDTKFLLTLSSVCDIFIYFEKKSVLKFPILHWQVEYLAQYTDMKYVAIPDCA